VITGAGQIIQVAHIYPYSQRTTSSSDSWLKAEVVITGMDIDKELKPYLQYPSSDAKLLTELASHLSRDRGQRGGGGCRGHLAGEEVHRSCEGTLKNEQHCHDILVVDREPTRKSQISKI
jgi:hypothetical protein